MCSKVAGFAPVTGGGSSVFTCAASAPAKLKAIVTAAAEYMFVVIGSALFRFLVGD
jgi:hypothetical protein